MGCTPPAPTSPGKHHFKEQFDALTMSLSDDTYPGGQQASPLLKCALPLILHVFVFLSTWKDPVPMEAIELDSSEQSCPAARRFEPLLSRLEAGARAAGAGA